MAQAQRNGGRNGVGYGPDARPVLLHEGQALPADGIQPQLYQLAADLQTEAPRHCGACGSADGCTWFGQCALLPVAGQPGCGRKAPRCSHWPRWAGGCPPLPGNSRCGPKAGSALRDCNSLPHKTGSDRPRLGKQVGIGRFLRPSKCRDGLLGRAEAALQCSCAGRHCGGVRESGIRFDGLWLGRCSDGLFADRCLCPKTL